MLDSMPAPFSDAGIEPLSPRRRGREIPQLTPFATWRSRLPATIGSWFARDLVLIAMSLVEAKRVTLRAVEDLKIESAVKDQRGTRDVAIEWGTGTGPLALRAVCTCGGSGICEHVVATLEAVRSQTELEETHPATPEVDLSWLPTARVESKGIRARSVWPVFSSPDGTTLAATLILDSPRLRGAVRDAAAIVAMMDATPLDDWDELDRELMRDEAVLEAFAGRSAQRALSRALFRLSRHPRLRFDDEPNASRHPSELPDFRIDLRGLTLRAIRRGTAFLPTFETFDGTRVSPKQAFLLDGPPTWVATPRAAYLIDGTFDAKRAIDAARSMNGSVPDAPLTPRTIARVAPFLTTEDRGALGIADAKSPGAEIALGWTGGALVATLTFTDGDSGARVPYAALGAIAPSGERFVRFTSEYATALRAKLIDAGFVPRSADGFALHGTDRAASFVRDVLPTWDDLERRLDPGLTDLVRGKTELDINVSAERSGEDANWFELKVDVFVGGSGEALTQKELAALLQSSGRYAEVRGKLVDVEKLRERNALLTDIAERRRSGLAALLAIRDELHDNFGNVSLPPDVEKMREKLRNFEGIPSVDAPDLVNGTLRGYQKLGLDFLTYLSEFGFGGILADEMGLGKAHPLHTRILTPFGWKCMRDIAVGDAVVSARGTSSRVTGVYPQGLKAIFRVTFSDGTTADCCDDHLWAVAPSHEHGAATDVLALREIRERLHDDAGMRYAIPLVEPVEFIEPVELPVDPYLFGTLVGKRSHARRLADRSAASVQFAERRSDAPTTTDTVVVEDADDARSTTLPDAYAFASVSSRIALLQGLMDADGCVGASGVLEYASASDRLADDVTFLVQSLGGTATIRSATSETLATSVMQQGERTNGGADRIEIVLPSSIAPFRLSPDARVYRPGARPTRAIVDIRQVEDAAAQCIAVDAPDHLYVIDDCVVTHNTVQVVSYLLRRKRHEGQAPSLVIAPTSVTHTWENEISRFAPDLKTLRLSSGSERAARYDDVAGADVVITSYALARLDAQQLSNYQFRALILDEAQNAKNPSSQIARVVRALHADHRLALTGTPVENSLRDLWAIFAFVEPGLLGSETSFRRRFEIPIADNDEKAINVLRSRLEPFLLRRTKEDVAPELPDRTEVALACDLSPLQRRLYRGVAEAARRDVFAVVEEQGIESATVHVLAALTRLRQICAHPGLLFDEYRDEPDASAKFEAFLETVEEILSGGHRLLVFSAFASMLKIMRAALDKRDISYGYLDGSTKDKDRQDEVARFMKPDGPPLFLCSLKAGGVGLTLTAADYVILYDPWWNPAVERQAIDRTHRIGQMRAVTAYRLVTTGTVEEKIRALAERKSSLSRNIIKADGALAKALTREDLETLFADPD
ncbi:MAG: hypothetical protein NVS1B2_01580 [Vulcanimicrobiaceae bacterium]